jgi:hypothetical protein
MTHDEIIKACKEMYATGHGPMKELLKIAIKNNGNINYEDIVELLEWAKEDTDYASDIWYSSHKSEYIKIKERMMITMVDYELSGKVIVFPPNIYNLYKNDFNKLFFQSVNCVVPYCPASNQINIARTDLDPNKYFVSEEFAKFFGLDLIDMINTYVLVEFKILN